MIVHFDVDAFYASVAVRDDPSLAGKPLVVAGNSRRAVVLTASYEARPFGVRSALPLYRALRACPQLVVVRPNHERYRELSQMIFEIAGQGRPLERLSLDEAFVQFEPDSSEEAARYAAAVRSRVRNEIGLAVSAGVAAGKMVAKIACDLCKPDGLRVVPEGREAEFLAPLPVSHLWGVGPKTQRRLAAWRIETIGQLAELQESVLRTLFGSSWAAVRSLARGEGERQVVPDHDYRSISTEETFEYDVTDKVQLEQTLGVQADELAARLAEDGLRAGTIGIKLKRADFTTVVRQTHLAEPAFRAEQILAASKHCLSRADCEAAPVRLLGTRLASLVKPKVEQPALFA